jgi:hypothetical protein
MSKHPRCKDVERLRAEFQPVLVELLRRCPWMQPWETWRSPGRQLMLFNKGPTVTKARPWQSAHNWGMAADCVLDPAVVVDLPTRIYKGKAWPSLWDTSRQDLRDLWIEYGEQAEALGLVWGGRWGTIINGIGFDPPHVEHPAWKSLRT